MTQTSDSVSEAVKLLRQAADLLDSRESGTLPQLTHQHRNRQSTTPTSSTVLQEQRQLFGRLNRPSATTTRLTNVISSTLRGNGNKEASQKRKKVKKILCMLASRSAIKVPSLQDRAILQANGLGDKTVYFPVHGTASDVKSSLMREFPALEDGGGFELLRTAERSRTDLIVSCVGACSVDHLCSISTGRVYIRPIQANLLIDNSRTVISSDELEECLSCGSLIPLEEIRKHLKDCKRTTNSETADQEEDVLSLENAPNNINSESGNQLHLQQVEDLPDPVEDVPIFERIPDNSESANLLDLQQTSSEPVGTDTFLNDIFKDLRTCMIQLLF